MSVVVGLLLVWVVVDAVDDDPADVTVGGPGRVAAADYGEAWPLTVDEGTLACDGDAVTFTGPDGTVYAVNGTAISRGMGGDIDGIWRDDPASRLVKVSMGPLIDAGLELCGGP